MKKVSLLVSLLCGFVLLAVPANAALYRGRIIDAVTKQPIAEAFVTLHRTVVRTDMDGLFQITGEGSQLGVRAYGYRRESVGVSRLTEKPQDIALAPFAPKGLYLSSYGIASKPLRQAALHLLEATELNALVIDVKGDRGMIAYPSTILLATQVGAQKVITIKDLKEVVTSLQEKGIYTIARIVTFKDHPLATARPDFAVKARDGTVWHDREKLAWADPFKPEVWNYNIAVALEAADSGFDEIQFDYVRFPDARGLVFSQANTESNRCAAISGFLQEARKQLLPYNVFLGVDIFGYACWNLNDTEIGQKLETLLPALDYYSPMLYPSGYHLGIPGYRNPVAHPYEIVYRSLKRAQERTQLPGVRFRPWLQAFRDYAFDRRLFTGKEIGLQIKAAEDFGANGWMLWNPRNVYSADGLQPENGAHH